MFNLEYYTYGGFVAITDALNRVALIFSDHNYVALFGTAFILGILVSIGAIITTQSKMERAALWDGFYLLLWAFAFSWDWFSPRGALPYTIQSSTVFKRFKTCPRASSCPQAC